MTPEIQGLTETEVEEMMEFLDKLRTTGHINMFMSPLIIRDHFNVDIATSKRVVGVWMETFSARHPK